MEDFLDEKFIVLNPGGIQVLFLKIINPAEGDHNVM